MKIDSQIAGQGAAQNSLPTYILARGKNLSTNRRLR